VQILTDTDFLWRQMTLAKLTYAEVHKRLAKRSSEKLLALLDERSIRVGDTAECLLSLREERQLVLAAIMDDKLKTRNGNVRALSFLLRRGRKMPEAIDAYLHLVHDSHRDVVAWALFGLVFLGNKRFIRNIQEALARPGIPERLRKRLELAVKALEEQDPFIFSPNFHDAGDVWKLDKQRFRDRIG
jgi:hypothetical protein